MSRFKCHPAIAFAVTAAVLSAVSSASTETSLAYEVVTRTVNYADLDLSGRAGVDTLYARIKDAARQVCASAYSDSRQLDSYYHEKRCKQQAIGRAVEEVHSPQLTNIHLGAGNEFGGSLRR